ncbi:MULTISPECIES: hypothetical protein [Ruminococcus]|uniref:Uncharacterized protein n=1 Tax=Ruminococcus flavefaciens TaxID=1265 RepID=A0A315XT79_RUMFL|nr:MULTISPECIES: hypothetical protein [Ruminococcus]MBR1429945.1 hypothetical protein [Ruminococcus sp.]PWJ09947.1 hypothetical protein IE37_03241 [Ruminococcus flavefaciens]SSA52098.1 hypothetical protein SAMN02910325_03241 [Ruminococcus flavefaciens]
MKNKTPYIVIAILFVIYNVIAFVIPTTKTSAFWICYAFTVISFAVQAYVWYATIGKKQDLKSKLLGSSVTYISAVYLAIQFVAFLIFMFVSSAPNWCAILVCVMILGISAVCMITTNAGTEMITATENKVAVKRQFIKDLQIEVEMLAETETDSEIKLKLTELAKKIRLSDPMSDPSLADLENEMSIKVASIDHSTDKSAAIAEVERLLLKRNKKVIAFKR